MSAIVILRLIVHDHDNLFVAAEAVHSIGISLKSQELTAIFLAIRLYCSFVMEYDIHTLLDLSTLATTVWVIYMIRFNLKSSYMADKDNFAPYFVLVPCSVLALFIHPSTSHNIIHRIFWAFCVYLESVSVLPQLRAMQNTKIVEPFTAHYVFALGIARFLSCAHWVLQVLDSRGHLLVALGYGLWPSMVLISEIVQTFILADFCYYYMKRFVLLSDYYFHSYISECDYPKCITVSGFFQCVWRAARSTPSFRCGITQHDFRLFSLLTYVTLCHFLFFPLSFRCYKVENWK
ncbi:ER lumen protein-retaining receptor erd-2.2 [Linum perenne]